MCKKNHGFFIPRYSIFRISSSLLYRTATSPQEDIFDMNNKEKKICPVCKSKDNRLWGRKGEWDILECKNCSHVFADLGEQSIFDGDSDEYREKYAHGNCETDQDAYNDLLGGERSGGHVDKCCHRVMEVLAKLPEVENRTWLDVGCGSGALVQRAEQKGYKAVGIEGGGWAEIASREKGIEIIHGFLQRGMLDQKFGIVSAIDVLEHQNEPYEFMHSCLDHLDETGYILIAVPCSDSLNARLLKARWPMVVPPSHAQYFKEKSFAHFAKECGCKVVATVRYNEASIPLLGRIRSFRRKYSEMLEGKKMGDQRLFVLQRIKQD